MVAVYEDHGISVMVSQNMATTVNQLLQNRSRLEKSKPDLVICVQGYISLMVRIDCFQILEHQHWKGVIHSTCSIVF